jgi:hypothetical protein
MPNDLIVFINESGTAKKAISKVARYTIADGFVDTSQNDLVIGNANAYSILKVLAAQAAWFYGTSLLIGRDSDGNINSIKPIAFQNLRVHSDGKYIYNETYSTKKEDKKKDIIYPGYAGIKITRQELANQIAEHGTKGEVLYHFNITPDCPIYPVPDYYAGIEDVRSSAEIQKYDLEAIYNGFVPSGILTIIGGLDDQTKDQAGNTERGYFESSLEGFTGNSKGEDGLSGRARLMVMEASTKEEVPVLQTYDAKAIIDAANTKRDVIDRAVCRVMGVHPVLLGFSDAAILGNRQAMANASDELAKNVTDLQTMICEVFKLLTGIEFELTQYQPVQYIPDKVLDKLTDDELRAIGGYEPLPVDPTQSKSNIDILNSMSPLVANKVLDSLTPDEIRALGGYAPKTVAV